MVNGLFSLISARSSFLSLSGFLYTEAICLPYSFSLSYLGLEVRQTIETIRGWVHQGVDVDTIVREINDTSYTQADIGLVITARALIKHAIGHKYVCPYFTYVAMGD